MKKFNFIIILLFITFLGNAQVVVNYPYKRVELLVNKEVKCVRTRDSEEYGYRGFYTDLNLTKIYKEKKGITPEQMIIGKTFKVMGLFDYINYDKTIHKGIMLKDDTNLTLYYKYNNESDRDYPFEVVGGLNVPDNFYCDYVEKSGTLLVGEMKPDAAIYRSKTEKNKNFTAIKLSSFFPTFQNKVGTEVTLLLENDTTLIFSLDVMATIHNDKTDKVEVKFFPSVNEVEILKKYKIKAWKVMDKETPFRQGEKFQGILKCISTMEIPG